MAIGPQAQSPHLFPGQPFQKGGDCIDGRGKDTGGFFLRDFDERLKVAQLQCAGFPTDHVGHISEALGGFEFAYSASDLRAPHPIDARWLVVFPAAGLHS
jgi:hypothetical protein